MAVQIKSTIDPQALSAAISGAGAFAERSLQESALKGQYQSEFTKNLISGFQTGLSHAQSVAEMKEQSRMFDEQLKAQKDWFDRDLELRRDISFRQMDLEKTRQEREHLLNRASMLLQVFQTSWVLNKSLSDTAFLKSMLSVMRGLLPANKDTK